jgi:serine phosphatase RsbU (regulator of sigma subunit)
VLPFAADAQSLSGDARQQEKNYQQQMERYQRQGNQRKILEYANKLAFLYWNNKLHTQAQSWFEKSLRLNQNLDNPNGVRKTHYYLGMVRSENRNYSGALTSFKNGLKISRQLKDKDSELSGLLNISQTFQLMGRLKSSNEYARQALELAKEQDELKSIRTCYGLLSENHKKLGNNDKSIRYFDLFSSVDQHLKNEEISEIRKESENQVSQVRTEKQQTEKELAREIEQRKMTQDSLQRVDSISRERQMQLTMKELENKRMQAQLKLEKTIRNSFIIGFILIAGFSLLLYHFYRQKKKANIMLEEQNQQIQKQNLQIQQQKDKLQLQNTKLNDSLTYAENIQEAILPVKTQLREIFETFILYRPKDIVSGDFYWFTQVRDHENQHTLTFLAVVDCTGHGVPGAFMSMIGNRIFNEIISEKKILEPDQILYELNGATVEALKQERTDNTDGMDVCLIKLEQNENPSKKVTFAGARRPLFYFDQDKNELKKIKGDRHSIGGINKNKKMKEFTNHTITLKRGDIMYLTTDGIFDQVNEKSKRFSTMRFTKTLYHYIDQDIETQGNRLEEAWEHFKGKSEQRDDMTVVGVKIR